MKQRIILAAASVAAMGVLAGCQTLPPGAEPGPNGTMAYDVLIEASEPGATIVANGQQIGNTPVHLKIFGDPDGTFHDFGSYYYEIRALPLGTNEFPQLKVFRTGHLFTPEDRIPQRIVFEMNQPPPTYGGPPQAYPPPAYPAPYYYPPPPYWYYSPGVRIYFGPGYYHHW